MLLKALYLTKTQNKKKLTVGINLVDHVLQLGLRGVLSQRPHDGAQLLGGDGAIAVLVDQAERLLELGDLLLGQLVGLQGDQTMKRSFFNK